MKNTKQCFENTQSIPISIKEQALFLYMFFLYFLNRFFIKKTKEKVKCIHILQQFRISACRKGQFLSIFVIKCANNVTFKILTYIN